MGRCTHFLSWVWGYKLSQVTEALNSWLAKTSQDPSMVFFYMCFFINNQFRILVEKTTTGSDNLEQVFERNLCRIGKVVAILDHWKDAKYLTRMWTIYEQYTAAKLEIQM